MSRLGGFSTDIGTLNSVREALHNLQIEVNELKSIKVKYVELEARLKTLEISNSAITAVIQDQLSDP